MAEEKKKPESKGSRRYGKGPKIEAAEKTGDKDKSGNMKEAKDEAEKTAADPEPHATMDADDGPEGTEAAGTGDIPVRHGAEMKEMGGRHRQEMKDMQARHLSEHSKMMKRHMSEMGTGDTAEETGEE